MPDAALIQNGDKVLIRGGKALSADGTAPYKRDVRITFKVHRNLKLFTLSPSQPQGPPHRPDRYGPAELLGRLHRDCAVEGARPGGARTEQH